jgi:hypothetical protein
VDIRGPARSLLVWHVPVNSARDATDTVCPVAIGRVPLKFRDMENSKYALQGFETDLAAASLAGKAAREFALAPFSLDRFPDQWRVLEERCG